MRIRVWSADGGRGGCGRCLFDVFREGAAEGEQFVFGKVMEGAAVGYRFFHFELAAVGLCTCTRQF